MYEKQISNILGTKKNVIPVDNNGGESLKRILAEINPDELIKRIFIDSLKDNYYAISETINYSISALKKSREENEKEISSLERALQEIISEKEKLLREAEEKYSQKNIEDIVNTIGKDLINNIDELVFVVKNSGKDAFSSTISDIIRNSIK